MIAETEFSWQAAVVEEASGARRLTIHQSPFQDLSEDRARCLLRILRDPIPRGRSPNDRPYAEAATSRPAARSS